MVAAESTIQANKHVVLDYELRADDGDLLDASEGEGGQPIRYVHGYGMLVPGLEAALAGLQVGDERDIVVPAEAGYGEYDEELVLEIERSEFPEPAAVAIGDEFVAESPEGEEIPMTVVEVKDDAVVVDAESPARGRDAAIQREGARRPRGHVAGDRGGAAGALDEAHEHVHGPDCDHSHDGPNGMVSLGKKPN